jgi:hypothetical protein
MTDPLKEMFDAAMGSLKPELVKLGRECVPFDERVWFVTDASEESGRELAVRNLSTYSGGSMERARADLDKFAEMARAKGQGFYVSTMLRPDNVMLMVDAMAGDDKRGIVGFRELLLKTPPQDQFRIVLVRDWGVHLFFVRVSPHCDVSYSPKSPGWKGRLN